MTGGLTEAERARRDVLNDKLIAHVFAALGVAGTEADIIETYEELQALENELDKLNASSREALASAATTAPAPESPKRSRNLLQEGRKVRKGAESAKMVADWIRATENPPREAPPMLQTQLQCALYLTENGVTSAEHLARILQINRRHASTLISRCRRIRSSSR